MNVQIRTINEDRPELVGKFDRLLKTNSISIEEKTDIINYLNVKNGKISFKRVYSIARALEKFVTYMAQYRKKNKIAKQPFKDMFSNENRIQAEALLTGYFNWQKDNYGPETINGDTAKIKAFFNWLFEDTTPKFIRTNLPNLETQGFDDTLVFAPDDIQAMIKESKSLRDRAMIAVQYETGSRVNSELLRMCIKDVYQDTNTKIWWANIPSTKTFSRKFPLKECVPHLTKYINTINTKDISKPLWQTYNDRINNKTHALSDRMYNKIIKSLCEKAGIDKNKPRIPYWLRHSGVYRNKKRFKSWPVFTRLHGWTENSAHARRYLHTDTSDIEEEFLVSQGKRKREDLKLEVRTCSICNHDNSLDSVYCESCQMPLDMDSAIEFMNEQQQMKARLEDQDRKLTELLAKMESLSDLKKALIISTGNGGG